MHTTHTDPHLIPLMERALELAAHGAFGASPNPMVGAVIINRSTGLIIGEGYHRHCGQGHAEVNAVAMALEAGHSLADARMYVTLEPCAHQGRTPSCARMIVARGIPEVVVGCQDPFARVAGRGIAILREAGVKVTMAPEEIQRRCLELNSRFITAHTLHRPYVTLKWARSADGFMDRCRTPEQQPAHLSSPLTRTLVHGVRAVHHAIAVGSRTLAMDRPLLDVRLWPGARAPQRVELTRAIPLEQQLHSLYAQRGITSLLVEGGPTLLRSFLEAGLWDAIRVETTSAMLGAGVVAPPVPARAVCHSTLVIGESELKTYKNPNFSPQNSI